MPKKFHLAWFSNFTVDEWLEPLASAGGAPWTGEFYVEMAKALERACFDYIMLEDTLMVSEAYGGNADHYLKHAVYVPKHDPAPLAAMIGSQTRHLGVVATLSTLGYHPFLLARLCATLDHITQGRFGWNIVTSAEIAAAQNFGLDELPPHDHRYDMADEFMDVVNQLFGSWESDAIRRDPASGTYVDPSKVRPIDFVGTYYKSRGPLNTAPLPQGRPAYVQAGGSPRGRDFAAKHADSIIASATGPKAMKAFRDDIRARATNFGRDPDSIKVLFLIAPVLGETEDEAKAKNERGISAPRFQQRALALYSALSDIDLSQFDLDQPLPALTTNGETTSLARLTQYGAAKTLRQIVMEHGKGGSIEAVGTPDQVADRMAAAMEEVGGDGFLIKQPFNHISRRYVLEVTEGLVPALQRRGLVRTGYAEPTLRRMLHEF
jgi:FMN-dependent oxidoreductase (nitrilotriacetate monooxygenase family)